jgi:hypothetical protein
LGVAGFPRQANAAGQVEVAPDPYQDPGIDLARMLAAGSFHPRPGVDVVYRSVNGDVAVVLRSEGAPFAVLVLDIAPEDGAVTGVYVVTNPGKLTHVS